MKVETLKDVLNGIHKARKVGLKEASVELNGVVTLLDADKMLNALKLLDYSAELVIGKDDGFIINIDWLNRRELHEKRMEEIGLC